MGASSGARRREQASRRRGRGTAMETRAARSLGFAIVLLALLPTGGCTKEGDTIIINEPPPAPPPPLAVAAVSPRGGAPAGGTRVLVTGTSFAAGAAVTFGTAAATSVTRLSSTALAVVAPAGTGTMSVTVTNPDATSVTLPFAFTYAAPATASTSLAAGARAEIGSTLTFTALSPTSPLPVSGDQYTIHEPAGVSIADSAVTPWLTDGALYVAGNAGSANAITDLSIMNVTNNISFTPFTQIDAASGESVVTNALVYDSIGNAHQVEVTYVLEAKGVVDPISGSVGNVWRVYTEAADSKQLSGAGVLLGTQRATGSGQLLFSTEGQFLSQTGTPGVGFVTINLPNQGAITPLTFTPDFSDVTGFGNTQSIVFMRSQDGLPTGILTDFQVDQDGVVKGIFTNGATRDLAQIMVARFPNPNGLEEDGANNFRVATNSGTPVISAPGQQSAGLIVGGALEASNVDFAKEFSDLIVAQRAFQANARVITRSDQMLETLVNIV